MRNSSVAAPRARRGGRCGAGAREPDRRGTSCASASREAEARSQSDADRKEKMCTISSLGSDAAPAACPHRAIRPRRRLPVPGRPRSPRAASQPSQLLQPAAATAPPGRPRLGFALVVGAAALTRTTTSMTREEGAEPSWVSAEPSAAQVAERGKGLCGGGLQIASLWPVNFTHARPRPAPQLKTLPCTGYEPGSGRIYFKEPGALPRLEAEAQQW